MKGSETLPIRDIPRQEGEHVILGQISILVEGKDGHRKSKALLVANKEEGAEHPFRAIDPLTEKPVELTPTRVHDAYIAIGMKPPENQKTKNVGEHYRIRVNKKRQLLNKALKAAKDHKNG